MLGRENASPVAPDVVRRKRVPCIVMPVARNAVVVDDDYFTRSPTASPCKRPRPSPSSHQISAGSVLSAAVIITPTKSPHSKYQCQSPAMKGCSARDDGAGTPSASAVSSGGGISQSQTQSQSPSIAMSPLTARAPLSSHSQLICCHRDLLTHHSISWMSMHMVMVMDMAIDKYCDCRCLCTGAVIGMYDS